MGAALLLAVPRAAMAATPATPTVLHLRQVAQRAVTRDRLMIDLRAEVTGADPRQVQAEVNRRMAAALAKAKSVPAVTAASSGYDTYPVTPEAVAGKPKPREEWRAIQNLALSSADFSAVLDLAGTLQGDGLLISSMRFGVSDRTLDMEEDALTVEALRRLEARAGRIAATLSLKVAAIRDITVGNAQGEGSGPPLAMMAARAGGAMPKPAAAAGKSTVSVAVEADILLAPNP